MKIAFRVLILVSPLFILATVISIAKFSFNKKIQAERQKILSQSVTSDKIITEDMIKQLPDPVKKWLKTSGVIGKKITSQVFVKQKAWMKMKPETKT